MNRKDNYNKKKFKELVSKEPSGFVKKQQAFKADRSNRMRSAKLALSILSILDHKNMTKADLARELNVSAQQVGKWLNGKANITLDTITKLEEALGYELLKVCKIDFERKSRNEKYVMKDLKERIVAVRKTKEDLQPEFVNSKKYTDEKDVDLTAYNSIEIAEDNLQPTG